MLRVKIYTVDQDTAEEYFEDECWLYEAIDSVNEPELAAIARRELLASGRFWLGGGACALSLMTLVREV